jgi:uncharacterized protein YndB with AHSA1/START domain
MTIDTSAPTGPVRKRIRVACDVDRAFRVFVEEIDRWWPVELLSRTADEQYAPGVTLERVVFEPRAGGRIYEVMSEGREGSWADVVVYEPPRRLVLAWKPNDRDEPPTEVEVRFEPEDDATLVLLEHRGWERLGDRAVEARRGHAGGWEIPLERFAAAIAG